MEALARQPIRQIQSMKPSIAFVFGTRPEVIKLAPVIGSFEDADGVIAKLWSTGQHREMLSQALKVFDLEPDRELALMGENQTLAGLSSRILTALDELIVAERPSLMVVQGDTTTAMIGSLAAYYRRVPVAHVEAGLRTNNKYSPFPEEMNRRLIGSIADLHFAPTESARHNLISEGIDPARVHVTGNTAIDALLLTVKRNEGEALAVCTMNGAEISSKDLAGKRLVLVTAHRRESHDSGLAAIAAAVKQIAALPDSIVIFALHYNPNVRAAVLPILNDCPNVHLTEPLDYVTFCRLMQRAFLILTDSGGIQEEAPSLGVPVLVMRDTTERREGIESGNAVLVGTSTDTIVDCALSLWEDASSYSRMQRAANPYGDGHAAQRIHSRILEKLSAGALG